MPALDYSQIAGYDPEAATGMWIHMRDGTRRRWVQQWYLEPAAGLGWTPERGDMAADDWQAV